MNLQLWAAAGAAAGAGRGGERSLGWLWQHLEAPCAWGPSVDRQPQALRVTQGLLLSSAVNNEWFCCISAWEEALLGTGRVIW